MQSWEYGESPEAQQKCLDLCLNEENISGAPPIGCMISWYFKKCMVNFVPGMVGGDGGTYYTCWILSKCESKHYVFFFEHLSGPTCPWVAFGG